MEIPKGYIRQHTLFNKNTFNETEPTKEWRRSNGMILHMPKSDETQLHREMDGLPRPSLELAKRALAHLASLPADMGRFRKFRSVTSLMWDIHDRRNGSPLALEALEFAEHFENQTIFYNNVLSEDDEKDLRRSN